MVLLSAAYRDTAVAVLAPFEYFSIIYGLFFGFFIWQEVPNVATIAGVVLIVGSGLYIIYRERENAGNLQRDFPHEI
jgi:drug/metabolite transporter (DMT)-like permease